MAKKETKASLQQSEVDHAIKNKLASIKALAELLKKQHRKDTATVVYLKKIDTHIDAIVAELDRESK